ncbi:MAG: trypsin-like peptidase domain-containing protein [Pseudomonadota bacterium]
MIWRLACVLTFALSASAQSQTHDRLDRRDKLLGYEAVGLLQTSRGNCTGALIARDVVLTAAHCVHGKGGEFQFRTGFSHGAALATRRVESVMISPAYLEAVATGDRKAQRPNDVALARLVSPITDPATAPYSIGDVPRPGSDLTLVSYGRGRMESLTLEEGCSLNNLYTGGVVGMDCSATFGSSGAPVFATKNGELEIVSIISGGNDDETLGVELSDVVPELMAMLGRKRALAPAQAQARRVSVGQRSGSGITFIQAK